MDVDHVGVGEIESHVLCMVSDVLGSLCGPKSGDAELICEKIVNLRRLGSQILNRMSIMCKCICLVGTLIARTYSGASFPKYSLTSSP